MGSSESKIRKERINQIKEKTFCPNLNNCFEKYLKGENFDQNRLCFYGYDKETAFKLSIFLNGHCNDALTW
ncbi:putative orfan [Tupanvirus soda lake]|uniref:Orfan n=2 Tax=Tupanvirus TaxID=2094720 RepID=A0AC62ADR9_9VIRU|nr:putative orfan [Tupanvirus soda lake]QKU35862.1 putative orfan [Tupanvirus soda lake]